MRESNRRVVNILDSITDGFIALDQEWRFTYINGQAAEIFKRMNRTRDELLGKHIWEEFPQAIGSIFFEQYHKAVAEQIAVQTEQLDGMIELARDKGTAFSITCAGLKYQTSG